MTTGKWVLKLQRLLSKYVYISEIDSCFGYGTEKAVKAFQELRGLKQSGVAGKVVWRHLGIRGRDGM